MNFLHIDETILFFFNQTLSNKFFDFLARFFDKPDPFIIPLVIIWLYFFIKGNRQRRISLLLILLVILLTDTFSSRIFKPLIGRSRPCAIYDLNLPIGFSSSFSMPSSHATNISGFSIYLIYLRKKWSYFLIPLIFFVSISRVYAGIHYPSDLVAGWTLGFLIASGVYLLRRRLICKKKNTANTAEI